MIINYFKNNQLELGTYTQKTPQGDTVYKIILKCNLGIC